MKIIKVSTELEMSVHEFHPVPSGNITKLCVNLSETAVTL